MRTRPILAPLLLFPLCACRPAATDDTSGCASLNPGPDDDPATWDVDSGVTWVPHISDPTFVIPGEGLPVTPQTANNNDALMIVDGLTFLAWRTAPSHFASSETEMHVISSPTGGAPWTWEATFSLGTDVREPAFLLQDGKLTLSFFEAGSNPAKFEPIATWRAERCRVGDWTAGATSKGEKVPWDVKTPE